MVDVNLKSALDGRLLIKSFLKRKNFLKKRSNAGALEREIVSEALKQKIILFYENLDYIHKNESWILLCNRKFENIGYHRYVPL